MPIRETEDWPYVPAKWFTKPAGRRSIRLIVIHTVEAPETRDTAEEIAKYFQTLKRKASAHVVVDYAKVIQCVKDNDVAFAAPGANHDGVHVELAGYAAQTAKQWNDVYSQQVLARAASVVAQYCLKYNLPAKQLTDGQLKMGEKGIVGHVQVSRVYKLSDHTDPGPYFPWQSFVKQVNDQIWKIR